MSWPQRGPPATPQQRAAPQTYGNQQSMYGGNHQAVPVAPNAQQQYWQTPQQAQYNQQYGQVYPPQPEYTGNANQYYQQQQYNQNYTNATNPGYNNTQQGYQQGYYQNQPVEQQAFKTGDTWEESWGDWGWDETGKAQNAAQKPAPGQPPPPTQQQQPLIYNNANVIEESFTATDTWSWATEDKKENKEPTLAPRQEHQESTAENPQVEAPDQKSVNNTSQPNAEEVRNLSDKDAKERIPNLALGKRFNLDNLTPQWSIESQMSQESSDGPHTHSEGTHRSENQSRNSGKSSPGLNMDNSNFNYSQSGLDEYPPSTEWSRHSIEDPTLIDNVQSSSRRESHDELSSSMQEMSIASRENPIPESAKVHEPKNIPEMVYQPPQSISPANFPLPTSSMLSHPPPPAASLPPAPPVTGALPPPPSSATALPPPVNLPPTSSNTNPFKQSGGFSHKRISSSTSSSVQSYPNTMSTTSLISPAAVNKVQHNRVPIGFGANLETTPDNSERPDQPQISAFRPTPTAQHVPDNLEVAPRNDRNEYLQTAHLSGGDYGENTDFSRNAPPPGLRRMVVGQQESEYRQNLNISGDEPPPGLARMVPGQQTETDNSYNHSNDNYLDRHIDGQPTDNIGRPYRQADGQQTPDNYPQAPSSRGPERRPIGFDRMVPGEPSNDDYSQYQGSNYGSSNDQRVVMGVDHDYPIPAGAGPSDVREQNVDGSDYSEHTPRNTSRSVIGARELPNDREVPQDYNPAPEEQQREVTMEGENLQDLSIISSSDLTFSREQTLDGADMNVNESADRKTDLSDAADNPMSNSRRQSINRVNSSGEDSERDRRRSPRREKQKSSRDRDRDKEGRYSRGDRKHERDERRTTRDDRRPDKERRERRDRDESPDARRHRRSTRSHRYETEDTDYYSDKERERRRYREGSYASKPPRPEREERDRTRRYNTIERDRRYERDDERDGHSRRERQRDRDRYGKYRDIDPRQKYGNIRREEEERRRGRAGEEVSRPGSGEAVRTDDDADAGERRRTRTERRARRHDAYYDVSGGYGAGYGSSYLSQRQQYQYYEQLRLADPAAYAILYKQLMSARAQPTQHIDYREHHKMIYGDGYAGEERGSVHSGRSSANGIKGNDTYYLVEGARAPRAEGSLRDALSLRTDASDRDGVTDASMTLPYMEEGGTVRSERMTPYKFTTAHVKANISTRDVVVVRPSYPVDGLPATVHVMSLAAACAADPQAAELAAYPGPLVKGVTHKKSVMEYCMMRARTSPRAAPADPVGYTLVWELLALLLRQNGVVVGADIAELLMKNKKEHDLRTPHSCKTAQHSNESRRGSSASVKEEESRAWTPEQHSASTSADLTPQEEVSSGGAGSGAVAGEDRAALDRLREYLIYGNRQEALEWAMSRSLWGHALQLAAYCERRQRAAVQQRFLASLPTADPLHTLHAALQGKMPPAATCGADERWGDWRAHAAILLANTSSKPDQDRRTLTQLGDSLNGRGLLYSAQFCYLSAGVQISRHPLTPLQPAPAPGAAPPACPRLALLLAPARAHTLRQLASNTAIFATEIYEYALSLNQDYVINELQVYKLVVACRLVDAGQYERALCYVEQASRAVTRAPHDYSPALIAQLANMADRLKYHDPALHEDPADEGGDSGEPSPRHTQQWLDDVHAAARVRAAESALSSPQHAPPAPPATAPPPAPPSGWGEHLAQYPAPAPAPAPAHDEHGDYSQYYQQHSVEQQQVEYQQQQPEQQYSYSGEEWRAGPGPEPAHSSYADPTFWPGGGYSQPAPAHDPAPAPAPAAPATHTPASGVGGGGAGDEDRPTPAITMPGGGGARAQLYPHDDDRPSSDDQAERDADTPQGSASKPAAGKEGAGKPGSGGGGGWLGGILTKLSLRAPNQMILPDDKNPTIVWDASTQRWRDLDAGEEAPHDHPPPPPPKMADIVQQAQIQGSASSAQAPPASASPVSNIFKMQKGRHIKKSYVDVFNPSGAPTRALPPPADVLGPAAAPLAPPPAYFVPATTLQGGVYESVSSEGDRYQSGI